VQNHNIRQFAVIAGALVLLVVFVSYRAQTFHYCVGNGERAQGRMAAATEVCGPNEMSMEWRDQWKEQGFGSKLKMVVRTAAAAFGAH
jgi:hypothetical protein